MRFANRIGWMLAGIVIGAFATSFVGSVRAQAPAKPDRLVWSDGGKRPSSGGVYFLKDTKSGGCWVVLDPGTGAQAMATAPTSACQ